MGSMKNVLEKHYRARDHFNEYNRGIVAFLNSEPGRMALQPQSTEQHHIYAFEVDAAIPPRLGLIAGDCLQCLRSCLDYLVWELVLASGGTPGKNNMFPIALTKAAFENAVTSQRRLDGVDANAIATIEELQPFRTHPAESQMSPLAVLEELTNLNKHRRMFLTAFEGKAFGQDKPDFPALTTSFSMGPDPSEMKVQGRIANYVAIQDGAWKGEEVSKILGTINKHIATEVLPKFKDYFPPDNPATTTA
jgi:hypothetical protein